MKSLSYTGSISLKEWKYEKERKFLKKRKRKIFPKTSTDLKIRSDFKNFLHSYQCFCLSWIKTATLGVTRYIHLSSPSQDLTHTSHVLVYTRKGPSHKYRMYSRHFLRYWVYSKLWYLHFLYIKLLFWRVYTPPPLARSKGPDNLEWVILPSREVGECSREGSEWKRRCISLLFLSSLSVLLTWVYHYFRVILRKVSSKTNYLWHLLD